MCECFEILMKTIDINCAIMCILDLATEKYSIKVFLIYLWAAQLKSIDCWFLIA